MSKIPPGVDLFCKGRSKAVHVDWGARAGAGEKEIEKKKGGGLAFNHCIESVSNILFFLVYNL